MSPIATPACRCCGGPTRFALTGRDINQRLGDEDFPYDRCARCATVQIRAIPPDLGRYYQPSYYDEIDLHTEQAALAEGSLQTFVDLLPGARLIEVGPGPGGLLRAAARAGITERVAVERDAACCARMAAEGVHTVETDDPIAGLDGLEPGDGVAMAHVLEHVPDPMGLLDAAAAKVRPGGVLMVAAPNPHSLSFKATGRWWLHLDAPRHLHLVPLRQVTARVTAAGLRLHHVLADDPQGLACDRGAWGRWAEHVGTRFGARFVLPTAQVLARPLERARPDLASTYTAVFIRPAELRGGRAARVPQAETGG